MSHVLALTIGEQAIEAPPGILTGGLPKLYDYGSNLLTLFFVIIIIVAFAFLLWGGIKWISSGGDKTKVDAARKTILYAIIGLIFIFLSFFIINVITIFFQVPSVTTVPQ